jgi:nucleoside-diphosphate-sugar epimerase
LPAERPPITERELASFYRNREVWVTGASGFLGSHLVRRLVGLGARCTALHRTSSSLARLEDVRSRVLLAPVDLGDREGLRRQLPRPGPSVLFHLAAYGVDPREHDLSSALRANVLGLVHLVEALEGTPLDSFVNTGTCAEYAGGIDRPLRESDPVDPRGAYAVSKSAAVMLGVMIARTRQWPLVTLRPFTFYGPGERSDRLIPHVLGCVLRGEEIRMTGGIQTRDFIYVEDVVEAYLRAGMPPVARGEVINLGSGKATPVRALVERIRELTGSQVPVLAGAVPYRADEQWHLCADIRRARELLGWSPRVDLDEGIRRTLEWLRASGSAPVPAP